MSELTPLMKQYLSIKEQHNDAIVLFRLGDFYEMFGEDAEKAHKILQIALTTRDKKKENPLPMCGIPYFASETYISKLVKAGYKVAICEQVEDPKEAKGIVKREVVRVITPGTHTPEHPKQNNYVLSLFPKGDVHGIALADASTGEFVIYETSRPIEDEISRFAPTEIVIPESLSENIHYRELLNEHFVSSTSDWVFDYPDAYRALLKHFGVASLEGFGCEGMEVAISAAGALISYIEDTQKENLRFRKMSTENQSSYMFLDAPTQRNLELVRTLKDNSHEGSLLWTIDETLTPMGGRFLRNSILRPLTNLDEIRNRQGAVNFLVEDYELTDRLRRSLRMIQDIERLAQRVSAGRANARDLIALKTSTGLLPAIKHALGNAIQGYLNSLGENISEFTELIALIEDAVVEHPPQTVKDGGIIKKGFRSEIDDLKELSTGAKDYIARIEADEKRETGISSLKVGYNKIHGYYIEVTKSNLNRVPDRYTRKQTLVGAERFITPELKEYESKVIGAEERLKGLEYEVFQEVLLKVKEQAPSLTETAAMLARVDFLVSLAVAAKRHNYTMPRMTDDESIDISNGRHPVLERLQMSEKFIPNDTQMDGDSERILVITGPNMAGKSTYMRQVALIMLMAQIGSFVPAEKASLGIVDRIFTRIGASDFLTRGQSTFMVEMIETANILNNATQSSLILLDEIGRGTSTFDGISIAWASAEYIANTIKARTLFATHYIELTELAHVLDGVKNYNIAVKEWGDEIIFLRRIEKGPADKSYGIQVARLAALPEEVIVNAREVLSKLEKQHVSDTARYFKQMDLFSPKQDMLIEAILSIDLDNLAPEETVARIKELLKKERTSKQS
jgi:DNA mismatch repair protein MutS